MTRALACISIAALYLLAKPYAGAITVAPVRVVAPISEIGAVAAKMKQADRQAMADGYALFSRAVEADPTNDPVFPDTAALRRAHRAMLLCVWRGVLDNDPGKVPGLKEAVERAFDQRIGSDEVLLNPTLKQSAAKALADIAASFK